MYRFEVDYSALGRPLLFLLLVATLITGMYWVSMDFRTGHEQVLQQARSRLENLRSDYRDAIEAGNIIHTSLADYRELQQRGFIGEEQRLIWIESLRTSGNVSQLSGLQYSLKQQQPVSTPGQGGEYYQLLASNMELHLDLLHEGSLLEFFRQLDQQKPALYQVRSCSMDSISDGTQLSLELPNISAICQLRWFTVRDPDTLATFAEDAF